LIIDPFSRGGVVVLRCGIGACVGAVCFVSNSPSFCRSAHILPCVGDSFSIFRGGFRQPPEIFARIVKLWQKTALPTAEAKFLKPRKQHRASRKARFKHEIVPSIPARHCCQMLISESPKSRVLRGTPR
jgi:hypothetical protein